MIFAQDSFLGLTTVWLVQNDSKCSKLSGSALHSLDSAPKIFNWFWKAYNRTVQLEAGLAILCCSQPTLPSPTAMQAIDTGDHNCQKMHSEGNNPCWVNFSARDVKEQLMYSILKPSVRLLAFYCVLSFPFLICFCLPTFPIQPAHCGGLLLRKTVSITPNNHLTCN